MVSVTREILRAELACFATDVIQKEFKSFKNELMLELRMEDLGIRAVRQNMQFPDTLCVEKSGASESSSAVPLQQSSTSRDDAYQPLIMLRESSREIESHMPENKSVGAKQVMTHYTPKAFPSRDVLYDIVKHEWFERFIILTIMSNVATFAVEVEYLAQHWETTSPSYFFSFEFLTFVIFIVEITLRMTVDRLAFFNGPRFFHNLFDLCLVVLQACEVTLLLTNFESHRSLSVLKVLRVTRVFRAGRILNLVPALHILFASIVSSVELLIWIMVLVVLTVGSFAVVLTQIVTEHKVTREREAPGQDVLDKNFGTVGRTMMKLYQVMTDGLHWNELVEPLMFYITPWAGIIFVTYSAFVTFVLLNVVAAVFVESAVAEAQQDHQTHLSNRLWKIFTRYPFASDLTLGLSEVQFNEQIHAPAMQDYLRKLGMDAETAKDMGLFHLLDRNHDGFVSLEEALKECVRLLGYARAVDLAALRREVHMGRIEGHEHRKRVDGVLQLLRDKFL